MQFTILFFLMWVLSVWDSGILCNKVVCAFNEYAISWSHLYSFHKYYITGVANQSKTKSHISYCVTAKNHIIHMGAHEHHNVSSSLKHIPWLGQIYYKYHTPTWQWLNFTSHLFLCMLFSGTSGNHIRSAWNQAKSHMWLTSRGLATPATLSSNKGEVFNTLRAGLQYIRTSISA